MFSFRLCACVCVSIQMTETGQVRQQDSARRGPSVSAYHEGYGALTAHRAATEGQR